MMSSIILKRLESLHNKIGNYSILSDEDAKTEIEYIIKNKQNSKNYLQKSYSIEEISPNDIRDILYTLPILENSEVKIFWVANRTGLVVVYRYFVENYDDLWYPYSDDIWITDNNRRWLLEIDHEEIIRYYQID